MKTLLLIAALFLPSLAQAQSSTSIYRLSQARRSPSVSERIHRARMANIEAEMAKEEDDFDELWGRGRQVAFDPSPEYMGMLDSYARTSVNISQSLNRPYGSPPMSMLELTQTMSDIRINTDNIRRITSMGPQYMQYYNERVRYYEGSQNPRSIWE